MPVGNLQYLEGPRGGKNNRFDCCDVCGLDCKHCGNGYLCEEKSISNKDIDVYTKQKAEKYFAVGGRMKILPFSFFKILFFKGIFVVKKALLIYNIIDK